MLRLYELIARVSQHRYPVLIQGESGTGKELVARAIHASGPWTGKPFLPIDCGSLVPTLIESELFGYAQGAFTGAEHSKEGLLAAAGNGTVFLDEIGEMPVGLQSKLLRALQEKEVRPVGGNQRIRIGTRIIAATNRDLDVDVRSGRFRKDLYFRLNVVSLRLPPLRERKSDIPLLVNGMIERHTSAGQPRWTVSDQAMNHLMAYHWPGNVRELENCIERAVSLGSGPVLRIGDLTANLRYGRGPDASAERESSAGPGSVLRGPSNSALEDNMALRAAAGAGGAPEDSITPWAELEKRAILSAVEDADGDKLRAARLLEIGKTTLYRKLKEWGLSK